MTSELIFKKIEKMEDKPFFEKIRKAIEIKLKNNNEELLINILLRNTMFVSRNHYIEFPPVFYPMIALLSNNVFNAENIEQIFKEAARNVLYEIYYNEIHKILDGNYE